MSDNTIRGAIEALNTLLTDEKFLADATAVDTKQNRSAATRIRKVLKQAMDDSKALRSACIEATRKD